MHEPLASDQTVSPVREITAPIRRPQTFQALAYRDYRLIWLGQMASHGSTWMEQVVRPLLVLDLTGSAVQLGIVSFLRLIPMVAVGVLAGAVADRFDRRRVLMVSQAATIAIHFTMAFLILSDRITLWQIYLTTLAAGVSMAFDSPARQSLIPMIVSREHMANAIALNSVATNITRIGAPSLAGLLIVPLGIGRIYLLNGALMVIAITLTAMISVRSGIGSEARLTLWRSLGEGFAYATRNRAVLAVLSLALAIYMFGMPYNQVFMPLIAKNVLEIGNSGLGFLFSAAGFGGLMGALAVASLNRFRLRGGLQLAGASLFGLSLVGFAFSSWLPWLAAPFLVVGMSGALQMIFLSSNNIFLLETAPPALHGRMMSLLSLDRGLISLGAVMAGFLAAAAGPQWGQVIMGSLCIGAAALVALVFPQMRRVG